MTPTFEEPKTLRELSESYVSLVLAVGQHDPAYVDAYYGPEEWATAAAAEQLGLDAIKDRAEVLIAWLQANPVPAEEVHETEHGTEAHSLEILQLRHEFLLTQLQSLVARVNLLAGAEMSFDEESMALYDAMAPVHEDAEFQTILGELDGELPGEGSLLDRYEAFQSDFIIPPEKLAAVFTTAIDECRARTLEHIDLPEGESFQIEYVTDKSWSAYNWYQGGFKSLIQVNTDLPISIDRAIDLACHEGYPGHHVFSVVREHHLHQIHGWDETTIYPLFSPMSLIAEGSANYGIEMAFPGDERVVFERETLFPLAGMDPARAELYYRVQELKERLSYAGNEAARRYLDGQINADAAASYLTTYALMSRPRAEQRVRFIDQYRSYVINYNLGLDMVRDYVEMRASEDPTEEYRWAVFLDLIASPRQPSGLNLHAHH
jgi:hypothetical protein